MPLPIIAKPQFPNVPQAPGVPPLLRQIGQVQSTVVLAVADAAIVLSTLGVLGGPQWGLFTQAGAPAFAAAGAGGIAAVVTNLLSGGSGLSVGDIEYRLDHRVATAPQEQGAFLSYNKVSTPFEGRVTYIVSGTAAQRSQFLSQVLALQKSLTLLNLTMPEYVYPSCTIVHHGLRRTAKDGVTMIAVDIWVEEVRITGTAAFSNSAAPAGAAQTNAGTVQPQTPTGAQTASLPSGNDTGPGTGGPTGVGGTGTGSTVGVPSQPYYDAQGNQIGVAPSTTIPADGSPQVVNVGGTPATNPLPPGAVGYYGNGQPVMGGTWQQGFYDSNMNWVHP